ncbi:hypothetical protein CDD83_3837 [Cordyceps sp. RAO-2017]|nr:hypothetical protein CDD83_3837 [Cordyceps sp. RAO-2017]
MAPSTPGLAVSDVDLERDWDELFATYWASWKSPLQAAGELTFSNLGRGGPEEAASFEAAKSTYLAAARADPDQHWIKVEDPGGGIVGGGCWTLCRHGARLALVQRPACGFETGSERDTLCRELYAQMRSRHLELMQDRTHAYGHGIWVLPDYRRGGAAAAVMNHWIEAVDKLGLEAYLESTAMSTALYLKSGFAIVEHPTMLFRRADPSQDWRRLVRQLQAQPIGIMWRPQRGGYAEGQTVLPWKGKPRRFKL